MYAHITVGQKVLQVRKINILRPSVLYAIKNAYYNMAVDLVLACVRGILLPFHIFFIQMTDYFFKKVCLFYRLQLTTYNSQCSKCSAECE